MFESWGENLRTLRKSRGMSQVNLAEKSGLDRSWISRIEKGKVPGATLKLLEKLSKGLDIPTELLILKLLKESKEQSTVYLDNNLRYYGQRIRVRCNTCDCHFWIKFSDELECIPEGELFEYYCPYCRISRWVCFEEEKQDKERIS